MREAAEHIQALQLQLAVEVAKEEDAFSTQLPHNLTNWPCLSCVCGGLRFLTFTTTAPSTGTGNFPLRSWTALTWDHQSYKHCSLQQFNTAAYPALISASALADVGGFRRGRVH
eukprot:TRINITY_DN59512_c0_g1_i1.p2 TRINITY_DN59512_c0_g1~~TRINITY_DN59512_c0_g1_i1.p2  ORF type:complete len:123 (+),score=9.59 TRINITY_DN59512_c0_g1_i1:28-369(+)